MLCIVLPCILSKCIYWYHLVLAILLLLQPLVPLRNQLHVLLSKKYFSIPLTMIGLTMIPLSRFPHLQNKYLHHRLLLPRWVAFLVHLLPVKLLPVNLVLCPSSTISKSLIVFWLTSFYLWYEWYYGKIIWLSEESLFIRWQMHARCFLSHL